MMKALKMFNKNAQMFKREKNGEIVVKDETIERLYEFITCVHMNFFMTK